MDAQIRTAILIGGAREADRIFLVMNTADNVLWEPFYFDSKECVRINQLHRFARLIYEDNKNNGDLTVVFNLLLLHMSAANSICKAIPSVPSKPDRRNTTGVP